MSQVTIYCPPSGNTISGECGTTEAFIWSEPSVSYVQYFTPSLNQKLIEFNFAYVSNLGASLTVELMYYRDNVYITAQTWNLGNLTTSESLYHYLDFGNTTGVNNYITLRITTTGGTSGRFNITLDCSITVVKQIFCTGNTLSESCNCNGQFYDIYAEATDAGLFPFNGSSWYTDPKLQNEAPCGNYHTNAGFQQIVYYYNCSTHLPEFYGNCPSGQCGFQSCSGVTSTYTHTKTPSTYKYINPFVETNTLKNTDWIPGDYYYSGFSRHCTTINFPQGSVGIYPITITYTGTRVPERWITFEDAAYSRTKDSPGIISYSPFTPSQSPFFITMLSDTLIEFTGNSMTFYIIPPKSGLVTVKFMIGGGGRGYSYPASITTTITPNCTTPTPIYKYNAGLHVYSAWDSIKTPRLSTTVYSLTPIGSWSKNNTILFNDNWFRQPAFPYWYSISGTTYKVGWPLRREWGSTYEYQILKKSFTNYGSVLKRISPFVDQTTTDPFTGYRRLPTCLHIQGTLGILKDIVPEINVIQPTKYKYIVGKQDGPFEFQKLESNDLYFNIIDPERPTSRNNCYTVTGFEFAINQLGDAYIAMMNQYLDNITGARERYGTLINSLQNNIYTKIGIASSISVALSISYSIGTFAFGNKSSNGVISSTENAKRQYKNSIAGARSPDFSHGAGSVSAFEFINQRVSDCNRNQKFGLAIVIVVVVLQLIYFLIKISQTIRECCKQFWVVNSSNPYIFVGDAIYLNKNMTALYDNGWICDGAYFYKIEGGAVTRKELSYTRARGGIVYSIYPDYPSLYVTDITQLFFLPFVSGIPDGYTTNPLYQSARIQGITLADTTITGELNNPLPNEFDLEQGAFTSDISQLDADTQAQDFFNEVTGYTQPIYAGFTYSPNVAVGLASFTHEIKEENTPRQVVCYYDNFDSSGLTIGKTAYTESGGYTKLLNGYYAFSSDTSYKEFYLILSGTVQDIFVMANSGSTTVTSTLTGGTVSISQTFKDYTSGWYQMSTQPIGQMILEGAWGSSEFYNSDLLKRGFVYTPASATTFYTYGTNNGVATSYTEAEPNYYKEVLTNAESFQYLNNQTIIIDMVQTCSLTGSGVNYVLKDLSGNSINSQVGVSFVSLIYTGYTFDSSHTITIQGEESEKLLELPFEYNGEITNVVISGYTSQNPLNKTTFSAGTFTSCVTPSPTPTPTSPEASYTPTPTVTPTPTLTPSGGVSYNFYDATLYDCSTCSDLGSVVVRSNLTLIADGRYYLESTSGNYVVISGATSGPSYDVVVSTSTNYGYTCPGICV